MQVVKTGVKSVDDLYGIDFTGNVIPHSWFEAIQTENGKPDLAAIVILAEILYWHRPTVERTADDAAVESYRELNDKCEITLTNIVLALLKKI